MWDTAQVGCEGWGGCCQDPEFSLCTGQNSRLTAAINPWTRSFEHSRPLPGLQRRGCVTARPLLAHTRRAQLSCFRGTPTASSELPACPLPTPGLGHFKPQVRTACPPAFCPHRPASLCPCPLASCFCFPGTLAQVKRRHRREGAGAGQRARNLLEASSGGPAGFVP